jgi:TolB-like protein/Tfp pilus assembly protein PilF
MGALAQGGTFLFDGYRLDRRGLFRPDDCGVSTPVAIGGRALDLLGVLVQRHGEILSKAEIMAAVWPVRVVEDGNLTLQISALRRILDRDRSGTSCIQTVARRGYCFVAEVTRVEAMTTAAAAAGIRGEAEASQGAAATSSGSTGSLPRLSIVVLPFTNLSNDPEHEFLADGITDDLTTDLSRIAESFVVACSTALTYKGKSADVKQVGRELGVRYVLEGSVRRSGGQIRINVQLIDAETGGHLWAERLDTEREKLAEAEDEITGRLARTLNLELVEAVGLRIEQERSIDPDAHDLAMRGWALFYRPRSAATLKDAQRAFEQALELDPQYVQARVGVATVLVAAIIEGWSSSPSDDQERVEELLGEVFTRGANDAMAHLAIAVLRRSQNRLTEARIEAERAVALDHNNSAALHELGLAYMYLCRPELAIPHIEKAIRLNPRDPLVSAMHYGLGRCHLLLGHIDQAVELFDRVRAASPRFWDVHMWLAGALGLKGDLDGARAELAEAQRLKPEIESFARWRAYQPSIAVPAYWTLRETTVNVGLRRAGFPEE